MLQGPVRGISRAARRRKRREAAPRGCRRAPSHYARTLRARRISAGSTSAERFPGEPAPRRLHVLGVSRHGPRATLSARAVFRQIAVLALVAALADGGWFVVGRLFPLIERFQRVASRKISVSGLFPRQRGARGWPSNDVPFPSWPGSYEGFWSIGRGAFFSLLAAGSVA